MELEDEVTNYPDCMHGIIDICSKYYFPESLNTETQPAYKLAINNSETFNLLMKHTMRKDIRQFILKNMRTNKCMPANLSPYKWYPHVSRGLKY